MRLFEGVRLALTQIRTERLKSFFSVLGVIIGVMFLVTVVSVVEGMDRYMRDEVAPQFVGVNTITVRRLPERDLDSEEGERRRWARRPPLTYDDAAAIRRGLSLPARVLVESRIGAEVVGDNGLRVTGVEIRAASADVFQVRDLVVEEGRPFTAQEAERGVSAAVLGHGTASTLFEDLDAIGRSVRIRGYPYRVVGVLEERGSLFGRSLDNLVVVPDRSPIKAVTNPRGIVDRIVVQTLDPAHVLDAKEELEGILRVERRLRPREANTFALETADETLSVWDRISRILFLALPGLVAIALIVGGIVIMNIMLVSVMQRTREIGVRKAIGARKKDILTQIIIESTTLSTVGAALGVGAGVALAGLVAGVSPLPAAIDAKWMALGVLLGTSVGILAGVYPASRAASMHPVDALRYE